MAAEEVYQNILEHLKKDGPLNTFRLARDLNLDRSKLLNLVKKLENAGAVEVQHGVVKFLKFVVEEKKVKKPVEVKKPVSRPKKKTIKKRKKHKKKPAAPKVQAENGILKSKAFGTPEAKPLSELKEKIIQLESKVEELEKKASALPKIIKKTIVKEVPAPSVPTPSSKKKKLKKVKKKPKKREQKKPKKVKRKSKKFRLPKFTFMKNIKQLKKPEFVKK